MEPEPKPTLLLFRRARQSGGAEKAADRLSVQFASIFEEVRLLVEGSAYGNGKIPVCKGPGWYRLITYAGAANRLLRDVGTETMSLSMERGVHAQVYRAGEGIHLAWMKRKGLLKSLLSLRPLHPVAIWLERRSIHSAKRVVANSEMIADEIRQYYPKHRDKVLVIENGYDETRFFVQSQRPRQGDDRRRLCFAGNGWERKGLENAIRLLARLPGDWSLSVLGKGNESKYRQLACHLKCETRVNFEGEVTNVAAYLNDSDAFILPTKYDPFSNACLEAAACGCPVITTRANGFSALIQHRENGFLFEENQVEECAKWLELPFAIDRYEVASRVAAYTIDKETEKYRSLFVEIAREEAETHSPTKRSQS